MYSSIFAWCISRAAVMFSVWEVEMYLTMLYVHASSLYMQVCSNKW